MLKSLSVYACTRNKLHRRDVTLFRAFLKQNKAVSASMVFFDVPGMFLYSPSHDIIKLRSQIYFYCKKQKLTFPCDPHIEDLLLFILRIARSVPSLS